MEGRPPGEIFSAAWSPHSERLAAIVGFDGIFVWNSASGDLVFSVPEEDLMPPNSVVVTWSPDGDLLATNIEILDAMTGESILLFERCPTFTNILDWHPNSKMVAFYLDDNVAICDITTDQVVVRLEGKTIDTNDEPIFWTYLYGLDWHPDGTLLAGTAGDGVVRIWQVQLLPEGE